MENKFKLMYNSGHDDNNDDDNNNDNADDDDWDGTVRTVIGA